MSLENFEDPRGRMARIKSRDNEVFKKAYLELKSSVEYAEANFNETAIPKCLKNVLEKYTPRFEQLSGNSRQSNSCQYR